MISIDKYEQIYKWPPELLAKIKISPSIINDNLLKFLNSMAIPKILFEQIAEIPARPLRELNLPMYNFERLETEVMLQMAAEEIHRPSSSNLMKLIEFLLLASRVQAELEATIDTSYDIFGIDYDPFEACNILKYFHLEAKHVHANEESKFMKFFENPKEDSNYGAKSNNSNQIAVNNVNGAQVAGMNQLSLDNVVPNSILQVANLSELLANNVLSGGELQTTHKANPLLEVKLIPNQMAVESFSTGDNLDDLDNVWSNSLIGFSKEDLDLAWSDDTIVYSRKEAERVWLDGNSNALNLTNDSGFSSPSKRSRQSSLSSTGSTACRLSFAKRLHVTNIPFVWRSPDIFKLFRPFGIIGKIQVIFNKEPIRKPLGYGYLTFACADEADLARVMIDQKIISYRDEYGIPTIRQLRVNLALPEKNPLTLEQEIKKFERQFSRNLKEYLGVSKQTKNDENHGYWTSN